MNVNRSLRRTGIVIWGIRIQPKKEDKNLEKHLFSSKEELMHVRNQPSLPRFAHQCQVPLSTEVQTPMPMAPWSLIPTGRNRPVHPWCHLWCILAHACHGLSHTREEWSPTIDNHEDNNINNNYRLLQTYSWWQEPGTKHFMLPVPFCQKDQDGAWGIYSDLRLICRWRHRRGVFPQHRVFPRGWSRFLI